MLRSFVALLCAVAALPAAAGDFVSGADSGTLARSFALPALGEGVVLPRGRSEWSGAFDLTSEYVKEGGCDDATPNECLILDGETARLRLSYRRGFGGWDAGIEVPLLHQGGGFLDGWIQDWHGWFGLPTGGRESRADDRYEYRYEDPSGAVLLNETDGEKDIGDVTVGVGLALGRRVALRGMAKLPTGDAATLSGGNGGGAVWMDAQLPLPATWNGFIAAGISVNDRGEVLPDQQNRQIPFGGVGLLLPVTQHLRIHAQVYAHGRLYDGSELEALSRPALPLTLGLQVLMGRRWALDLGFQEDLSVNASPDFEAYIRLKFRG